MKKNRTRQNRHEAISHRWRTQPPPQRTKKKGKKQNLAIQVVPSGGAVLHQHIQYGRSMESLRSRE